MNTKNTTRKGFTTVELVIVIAVIAILAVVLVPTFSNLIEKANLSSDKQNVRNMNICLTTEIASSIKANKPEHFGTVRELLRQYGYGKDDNFVAKTKGHSFRWFIDTKGDNDKSNDKSVIVLVNAEGIVVFPEEYKGVNASNIRMFFDLSLPAMTVTKGDAPESVTIPDIGNVELAVKYTFAASPDISTKYYNWKADYYVAVDLPEGRGADETIDIVTAGFYQGYPWTPYPMSLSENDGYIALLGEQFNYEFIHTVVQKFECGVVDPNLYPAYGFSTPPAGAVMKVELRLTSDTGEQVVLGVFEYEFK